MKRRLYDGSLIVRRHDNRETAPLAGLRGSSKPLRYREQDLCTQEGRRQQQQQSGAAKNYFYYRYHTIWSATIRSARMP